MSRTSVSNPTATPEELRDAELRAEKAERRAEQLEQRLEALESAKPQPVSKPSEHRAPDAQPGDASNAGEDNENQVLAALRNEPMMDHLLNALDAGQDIGHYGRLVFAMVGHHFLSEDAMLHWLTKDPGTNPEEVTALLRQVEGRDYNPPRRDRILAWHSQQEFPILPNPDDPDCGNVYRNLKFPQSVYEHIQEYQEEKIQAQEHETEAADSR